MPCIAGFTSLKKASALIRILIADDHDAVRRGVRSVLLSRSDIEICAEVANGRDAIDEALQCKPDVIILDLTMPVMGGEEALERIHKIRPDVPVLLSSGFSETEATRRFHDRGLAGFLQKPYTATVLARKVQDAVRLNSEAGEPGTSPAGHGSQESAARSQNAGGAGRPAGG